MIDERIAALEARIVEVRQQLDAAEPDLPAWEAEARLRRLEHELTHLREGRVGELVVAGGSGRPAPG